MSETIHEVEPAAEPQPELSATEKLRELVTALEQAGDVQTLRSLVSAQTALALDEQQRHLAQEHTSFVARFEALVERFERALEDGRGAIARELGELVMGRPVAEPALPPVVFNLDRHPSTYDVEELGLCDSRSGSLTDGSR